MCTYSGTCDDRLAAVSVADPFHILDTAIAERAFPGAVVWLADAGGMRYHTARGKLAWDNNAAATGPDTVYDLASLTKLFTMAAALALAGQGVLRLDTPFGRLLPQYAGPVFADVDLVRLMNHSSGVRIGVQALAEQPVETWHDQIAAAEKPPAGDVLYSCTSYFLLARALEAAAGRPLDEIICDTILQPLGMSETTFVPLRDCAPERIAPTEVDAVSGRPWRGVVHDEAARAWTAATGTCCGNAGLFGTARDLAKFARLWMEEGAAGARQLLPADLVRRAFTDTIPEQSWRRGWGWQVEARFFMGEAPQGTAGHTGFTGPTLALNPHTGHIVIVLNNRVHPTRHGPDRMPFHRALAEWCYAQ